MEHGRVGCAVVRRQHGSRVVAMNVCCGAKVMSERVQLLWWLQTLLCIVCRGSGWIWGSGPVLNSFTRKRCGYSSSWRNHFDKYLEQ